MTLLIATCLLGTTIPTQAQESATCQALATVMSALTVTGTNDLNFGSVTPGTPTTIATTDIGSAGEFTITGAPAAEVDLDFTLPDSLRTGGGAAMDIVFTATDAAYEDGTGGGQVTPAGILNPLITETSNIGAGGIYTLWIGGRVDPGVAQTGGSYTGTITLTVTLTGN
jgi:hypothetical protein